MAEWVAHQTAEQKVGSSNPGIPPLLKHECGEGDWLLCWHYTLAKVSHQRWISGNIYHVRLSTVQRRQNPLWLWNPEETSPEVQNRSISGSTNGHVSYKLFFKKRSRDFYSKPFVICFVIVCMFHYNANGLTCFSYQYPFHTNKMYIQPSYYHIMGIEKLKTKSITNNMSWSSFIARQYVTISLGLVKKLSGADWMASTVMDCSLY